VRVFRLQNAFELGRLAPQSFRSDDVRHHPPGDATD
jgi:hypothetical protein